MLFNEIIKSFPKNFVFGTATSSYQIEGSSFGGCGENHWDTFSKTKNATYKNQNGRIACRHVTHWEKDLDLIADAGFKAYRFSFSWPRIISDGKHQENPVGISFYDRLIDGMLERNILPFATLYHWDLPESLAQAGGWTNRETCKWFGSYSEVAMKYFGDRLYSVATINEPWCVAWLSHYLGHHAPGLKNFESAVRSMHFILVAHAEAVSVLKSSGHENIGIVLNKQYMAPETNSENDNLACQLSDEIHNLWFDEAIFKGQYPEKVLEIFAPYMPEKFENDLIKISNKLDWIGINYYTRSIIANDSNEENIGFTTKTGNLPKTDMGWEVFPDGLSFLIKRLVKEYSGSLPIHITENGLANKDTIINGKINDEQRVNFYKLHLQQILALIKGDFPIKSFFVWSLLDNFEWAFGYNKRFGIVHVDFKNQIRTPKKSYHTFKSALSQR